MERWVKDIYYWYTKDNPKIRDLNEANTILEENFIGFYKSPNWKLYNSSKLTISNRFSDEPTLQRCINEMSKDGILG